jgi:adenylate cyclase
VFGCIMPAVDAAGGEVLKLIGDGLLAIFPRGDAPPGKVATAALRAAVAATAAIAALPLEPPARCGMALHVGEVSYGNIGSGNRLDFTAIGPAVNLTARLEPLTAALQRSLVVSAAFAAVVDADFEPLGSFALRGFAEPVPLFGLAA